MEEVKETKETKKINLKKICIFALIAVLFIVCLIFIFKLNGKKDESYKESALYTEALFIKNKKGKIALYNQSGKKVTDFIYESAGTFYNGVAFVMLKDAKYAVINEKGKEVVKADKYDAISDYNGFFKAKKGDLYYLLSIEGKEIISGKSLTINTYNKYAPFALVNDGNTYYVYANDGKELLKFNKAKKEESRPTVSHLNEYASVFYDGKTTVLNLKSKKVVTEIKATDQYCVNNITEDKKIITLNSCTSWFSSNSKADNHGIISGNKFIDLSKKCSNFNVYGNTVVCSSDDAAYILKVKGSKVEYSKNIRSNAAFYDFNNYAIRNIKSGKVEFYKNGKKVASVKGTLSALGKMEENTYLLSDEKGFSYYNIKGKKVINESFKSARAFDKNGNAIVGDGKNYYLINGKGKTISEKYPSITNSDTYYTVSNAAGSKGILNKNGKVVLDTDYSSISIRVRYNTYYAQATTSKGTKEIYNLDSKKKLLSTTDNVTFTDQIIKVDNKNSEIYNYKGKLIYSEK